MIFDPDFCSEELETMLVAGPWDEYVSLYQYRSC